MSVSNHGGAQLAEAVRHAYAAGQDDYHLEPMVLTERGIPVGRIRDHDAVVFCCRRGEREIELTELFTADDFRAVERRKLKDLYFAILTLYHDKFKHLPIAFVPEHVVKPLAQVLSEAGKTQFHCAESEKFAHVTFFFNGGERTPFPGEEDVCVPSPKGIDFDQKPELSLPEVERTVTDALGKYDFIVTNFANGDVIGHTQNTAAKLDACGYVSRALEQVVDAALAQDYVVAITADHGNIEKLYTAAGKPDGAHTTNLVPFILIDSRQEDPISLRDGALCDVAPTILDVMGLPQPLEMTGRSLAEGHAWSRGRRMLLIICDGWGLGAGDEGDAIHLAHTPYWDALLENRSWCRLQADQGKPASYAWFFDRQLPGDDNGAWHSSDLWYWFGTLDHCWRPLTAKDRLLSEQMVQYLTNFATTGNPNGGGLPVWEAIRKGQSKILRLGEGTTHMGGVNMVKLTHTMLTNKAVGE